MKRLVLALLLLLASIRASAQFTCASGTQGCPTYTSTTVQFPALTVATQAATDNSTSAASTAYVTTAVSNAIAAVNPAVAVTAATNAILPNSPTYNNGTSGIGAFITTVTLNTALVVDGVTPGLLGRVLVKNEASGGGLGAAKNGVYYVSQLATVGLPWILVRALDFDQPSDINNTGAIPVVNGTVNTQTQWVVTSSVATVGTDAMTFTQFSVNPSTIFTTAGGSLTGTGTNTVALSATPAATSMTLSAPGTSSTDVPNLTSTNTLTNKAITPRVTSITSSATPAPTASTDDTYVITALAAGAVFGSPGTGVQGQRIIIRIKDNGTARSLDFTNSAYRASSSLAFPTTTTINKTMYLMIDYNSTDSKWDLLAYLDNF